MASTRRLRRALVAVTAALACVGAIAVSPASATGTPRIDLRVLVLSDGSPWVEGIRNQLNIEGVPTTVVDLNSSARPAIDDAFLHDTVNGDPRAKFQSIVKPADYVPALSYAETVAITGYETTFGIREVAAFNWANPTLGLNYAGYAGSVDGVTAQVTATAKANGFGSLAGPVKFEDNDPAISESYGYLATPLADDPAHSAHFEPYVTATAGGVTNGTLAGVYTRDGRESMIITFAFNSMQHQFQLLGHGIISWMTKGLHLGFNRNYFAVHADDTFSSDSRWSISGNCTPGESDNNCAPGTTTPPDIRMTAADVTYLKNWQNSHNFKIDQYYNGGSSDLWKDDHNGQDPLLDAYLADKASFRWGNHTYTHEFLGCVQNFTTVPWHCDTNPDGSIKYQTQAFIDDQIGQNLTWATSKGITVDPEEFLSGEHSGFFLSPQQPQDNPNFAASLASHNIKYAGSDNSRDPLTRQVGGAQTVPRYPMAVYFNTGTKQEMADEYNYIYTSRANGGSGICEDNPQTTTCITPINTTTGYDNYIVPLEVGIDMRHVLANNPRPHYFHVSNLAEDRIGYAPIEGVLSQYGTEHNANTPLLNPSLKEAGQAMQAAATWSSIKDSVTAYVQNGVVTIDAPAGATVPVTAPTGSKLNSASGPGFGAAYAGEVSAYQQGDFTLYLP
ncbi:hypothetical protein D5S17_18770 [Pseudonocardiaceae bacterium YIM PH 21723]|nr:hypothetical protein D5S17_18770 [Pseudonocardiaceae bacterium YIM PH 21723]